MAHFGILCLPATSHLNTMFPLGQELQRRGHRVTVLSSPKVQVETEARGFHFHEVYSLSAAKEKIQPAKVGKLGNLANIRP